jgi:alkanesulfonate monooxygenase SsuD/methylene tetrahydromethanopterin reductase-like flavin-dependent oxidoreductase (luciferase family)
MTGSPFPRSAEIRGANPVFNSNPLKLGVFGINQSGCAKTLAPERLVPRWKDTMEVGQLADRYGLEAIVSVSRWKSLIPGKPNDPSGHILEPLAWAGAMALATEYSAIIATCHVAAYPPMLLAKQTATLDQIAGGRFGINVVAGWNRPEAALFGVQITDTTDRYAMATEWMEIVQKLWTTEEDEFDYRGTYYTIEGAHMMPLPAQDPGPAIMNAGGSDRGREFCGAFADIALITTKGEDPTKAGPQVESYREAGREHGRELQVWTPIYIVAGNTAAEVEERRRRLDALGDYESARTQIDGLRAAWNLSEEAERILTRRIIEGGGGFPIIGSPEQIVDQLEALHECGIDGVIVNWIDYVDGLHHFAERVLPLLEERGLRQPQRVAASAA